MECIIGVSGHRNFDVSKFNYVKFLEECVKNRVTHVLNGAAGGFDIHVAEICSIVEISYDFYLPYSGYNIKGRLAAGVNKEVLNIYSEQEEYDNPSCYHRRNRRIVDHCDLLFVYYDGRTSGGTYETIQYAKQINVPVINFYQDGVSG
jgi:hypothetical protein